LRHDAYATVEARWASRALLRRDQVMLAVLLAQVKLRGMEEIIDRLERAGKASGSLLLLQQSIWLLQYLRPIMRECLLIIIAGSD
jgi:hypothetical protein